jgi:hypothetical protein
VYVNTIPFGAVISPNCTSMNWSTHSASQETENLENHSPKLSSKSQATQHRSSIVAVLTAQSGGRKQLRWKSTCQKLGSPRAMETDSSCHGSAVLRELGKELSVS